MSYDRVPLGSCCEVVSGATPKTGISEYWDGDILWATPKDLSGLEGKCIEDTHRKITQAGLRSCGASVLPVGSVLLSSRAPIGHVAINAKPMATNQGFKSFVPKPDLVDASYLYHWLKANRSFLESLGNGATFKEVSKSVVQKIEVPLPSLSEQRWISQVLDHVDVLRTKRRRALTLLGELAQSIFLDMFGDPARNPLGWRVKRVGDLLESASYGTSAKASEVGTIPVLRMNNITSRGEIDLGDLKYMDRQEVGDRYLVRRGDILFNRTNSVDLVGKSAVYRGEDPLAYAGYLVRLRVNDSNNPEYLAAFLNTRYAKRLLRGMCKSIIGMANINARELQSIEVAEPPLGLQREFAARIGSVETLRKVHRMHLASLDSLFASVRQRAFQGELRPDGVPAI